MRGNRKGKSLPHPPSYPPNISYSSTPFPPACSVESTTPPFLTNRPSLPPFPPFCSFALGVEQNSCNFDFLGVKNSFTLRNSFILSWNFPYCSRVKQVVRTVAFDNFLNFADGMLDIWELGEAAWKIRNSFLIFTLTVCRLCSIRVWKSWRFWVWRCQIHWNA